MRKKGKLTAEQRERLMIYTQNEVKETSKRKENDKDIRNNSSDTQHKEKGGKTEAKKKQNTKKSYSKA